MIFQEHAVISNSKARSQNIKSIHSTTLYFSPLPWKHPSSLSKFPPWPPNLLFWKWPMFFPLPKCPLPEGGQSQGKIMMEYSLEWSLPLLWLWTNSSKPQNEQVHWLITKASVSSEFLGQNSLQAPCLNIDPLKLFNTYVDINTKPVIRGKCC